MQNSQLFLNLNFYTKSSWTLQQILQRSVHKKPFVNKKRKAGQFKILSEEHNSDILFHNTLDTAWEMTYVFVYWDWTGWNFARTYCRLVRTPLSRKCQVFTGNHLQCYSIISEKKIIHMPLHRFQVIVLQWLFYIHLHQVILNLHLNVYDNFIFGVMINFTNQGLEIWA